MLKIITILTIYLTISSSSLHAENKSIDSKNEILLKEKCSSCHSLKMIYQQRLSKSRWEEIILSMHKHGMTKLTKSDYINIIKYLSKHYNQ